MGPRQVFKEAMFPPSLPQQQAANSHPSSGVITCLHWCWPVTGSAGVPRAWPQAAPLGEPSTAPVRHWGAPSGGVRAAPRKKPKFTGAQGMQGELSRLDRWGPVLEWPLPSHGPGGQGLEGREGTVPTLGVSFQVLP